MISVKETRLKFKLGLEEFAALLGVCESTMKYQEAKQRPHSSLIQSTIHLMTHVDVPVTVLLIQWKERRPRDRDHVGVLFRIARRNLSNHHMSEWESAMRNAHPQFF